MFVTFEGVDGSGKTTQAKLLARYCESALINHILIKEPGETAVGAQLRKIVLSGDYNLDPVTELMLFSADRRENVQKIIKPALTEGKLVLCDRYIDSTVAYQGFLKDSDFEIVFDLIHYATDGLQPSLTLLYTVDYDTYLKRVSQRGGMNKFDKMDCKEFDKLCDGFEFCKRAGSRVVEIDGNGSAEEVFERTLKVFKDGLSYN